MIKTLSLLPGSFWVSILLLLGGGAWAATRIRTGIGLPVLAVLGTVGAWYVGDVLYNDYPNYHAQIFTPKVLENAWWQVAWFVTVFLILAPVVHHWLNGKLSQHSSQIYRMVQTGAGDPRFQSNLNLFFRGTLLVWLVLVTIAWIRLGGDIFYYFFPYFGNSIVDPWNRGRIGQGFDALISIMEHLQLFLAAMFGVVAALARNPAVRSLALICVCLTWPNYIFARARNTLLAAVIPAILAWVFIRLRSGWKLKLLILGVSFMILNAWLAFIIAHRSDSSIVAAARNSDIKQEGKQQARHEGLNMFEELCWINTLIASGDYHPNWGQRYFSELVNPIPRTLWPGKPMIGIDYALARGQGYENADAGDAGVGATLSTGMIGQGVVNFGHVLGPAFAAFLMSLWIAIMSRLDLQGQRPGRLPLFALGLIMTFNLGRDITFLTLYTFVFGAMVIWFAERYLIPAAPALNRRNPNGNIRSRNRRSTPRKK